MCQGNLAAEERGAFQGTARVILEAIFFINIFLHELINLEINLIFLDGTLEYRLLIQVWEIDDSFS